MSQKIVNFILDGNDYGIDIKEVLEIFPYKDTVFIPNVHEHLDGVVDIRGEVVPVLNMQKKMELEIKEDTKDSRVILVNTHAGKVGLKVDSVKNVVELSDEKIANVPGFMNQMNVTYLDAFGRINSHLMIMINLEGLFRNYGLDDVVSGSRISAEQVQKIKQSHLERKEPKKGTKKSSFSKKTHHSKKHESNTNYPCAKCNKFFKSERGLKIHNTRMHG